MEKMLVGLSQTDGILDDQIITGENDAQYTQNFHGTLKKLDDSGAKLKKSKCAIMQPKIEYFAFVVNSEGIHRSPAKLQAIPEEPEPKNKGELQSFLGLVNYYRTFIPDMSTLVNLMNQLLAKDVPWCWSPECKASFQRYTDFVICFRPLQSQATSTELATGTSQIGLGAVISYITENGNKHPIPYASRSLTKAERNYSVSEKEALAIIFGIRKFQQ